MIKNDRWIREFGEAGGISPFSFEQVNSASYDVVLGNSWLVPCQFDPWMKSEFSLRFFTFNRDEFILKPNEVVLATTLEFVKIPKNVCCDLKLKSTIGRSFINHTLAGWVDPGFNGQITLELHNIGPNPYVLKHGDKIAQLVFLGMEEPAECAYGEKNTDKYQNQLGATAPKI
jgi:dCTP deaminase